VGLHVKVVNYLKSRYVKFSFGALALFCASFSAQAIEVAESGHSKSYAAINTIDGILSAESRWTSKGDGQWVRYNLEDVMTISSVDVAFHAGVSRIY